MFWNILCLSAQNPTFPYPKTYGSALRNVGFAQGKHKNHLYTFPFTPLSFTEL